MASGGGWFLSVSLLNTLKRGYHSLSFDTTLYSFSPVYV